MSAVNAWRRWAFAPADTAPMAALRIACGLLTLGWTVSLLPDAQAFLAGDGLTSDAVSGSAGWWTLPVSPYGSLAVLAAAALALTAGWHTRVAAVVVTLLLIIIQRRDVYILNSGDLLLRELAFYVALMPAGECWSLDARKRIPQLRAPWGLRLLQLQISIVYLFSVTAKLHGSNWQNGTAVGMSVQLHDLRRVVLPQSFATSVILSAMLTYGTLAVEASLVLGLWFARTRWWVMAAGVAMHLGIELTLLIGWFSLTIICCYLAFVPGQTLRRVVSRVKAVVAVRGVRSVGGRGGEQGGRLDRTDVHPAVVHRQDAQQRRVEQPPGAPRPGHRLQDGG
ncbi:MAG: HTTM domain-containing protein [Jatrophihabitantaceae bacterium]